jgi:hypothetical protein
MNIIQAMNEREAREQAVEWQAWQANESLSYDEVLEWQAYFESIAREYDLIEEFKENGIL